MNRPDLDAIAARCGSADVSALIVYAREMEAEVDRLRDGDIAIYREAQRLRAQVEMLREQLRPLSDDALVEFVADAWWFSGEGPRGQLTADHRDRARGVVVALATAGQLRREDPNWGADRRDR